MRRVFLLVACVAFGRLAGAQTESQLVAVRFSWEYHGMPATMRIHEPASGEYPIWLTGVVDKLSDAPVGREIERGTIYARPGDKKRFVLVYKNTTDKTIRFFANPHENKPPTMGLGFGFQCLCINHLYSVPPGKYWYRIVSFDLEKDFEGTSMECKHHLAARSLKSPDDAKPKARVIGHDDGP